MKGLIGLQCFNQMRLVKKVVYRFDPILGNEDIETQRL